MVRHVWFGTAGAFWAAMMALLIAYDVVPSERRGGRPTYRSVLQDVEEPRREVLDVFYDGKLAGTAETLYEKLPADRGYKIQHDLRLRLSHIQAVDLTSKTFVSAEFLLLRIEVRCALRLGGLPLELYVQGVRVPEENVLDTAIHFGDEVTHQRFPMPEDATLATGMSPFDGIPNLRVGRTWDMQIFDVFSPNDLRAVRMEVERDEFLSWGDAEYRTYVVCMDDDGRKSYAWITPEGVVLKQVLGDPPITLVRRP